jgi:hypothetical protein
MYVDEEGMKPSEFQEVEDETSDSFTQELGNSQANPNFKRRENPKEYRNQLDKLLDEGNELEDAFSQLGIRANKESECR